MGNYFLQLRDLASGEELCHDPPSLGMLHRVSIGYQSSARNCSHKY